MATYHHLTSYQTFMMTILVIMSVFAGVPSLIKIFRKPQLHYLFSMFMMSSIASFFYHLSEVYEFTDVNFFLSKIQWQRMDNVFTISSIQLVILYLCGVLHNDTWFLQYSCLINTVIIQEKDPWNFSYTVWPILTYLFIGLAFRIYNSYYCIVKVKYFKKNIMLSMIFLATGVAFFIDGLDDQNDYLRASHGMWHVSIAVFGWFAFQSVQIVQIKPSYQSIKSFNQTPNPSNQTLKSSYGY